MRVVAELRIIYLFCNNPRFRYIYLCEDENEINKKVYFKTEKLTILAQNKDEINKKVDFCANCTIIYNITLMECGLI